MSKRPKWRLQLLPFDDRRRSARPGCWSSGRSSRSPEGHILAPRRCRARYRFMTSLIEWRKGLGDSDCSSRRSGGPRHPAGVILDGGGICEKGVGVDVPLHARRAAGRVYVTGQGGPAPQPGHPPRQGQNRHRWSTPPNRRFTVLSRLGAADPGLRSNGMAGTQANLAWETLLDLSATRPGPLHMRLAAAIRAAIRAGRLPVGAALPPSRMLAADLGVSRWTVTEAYGQLITEGYLTGKTGSATRVTWSPRPGDEPRGDPTRARSARPPGRPRRRGFDLGSYRPDLRAFPRRQWVEAIRAAAETAPFDRLSYSEPGGMPELRAVLAEHLNRSRGAAAEPGTICRRHGGRAGHVPALPRAAWQTGIPRSAWRIPGSPRLWQAAQDAGLELVPLPVDDDGLVVDALRRASRRCAPCAWARPGRSHSAARWPRIAARRWWTGRDGWTGWSSRTTTTPSSATTGPTPPVMQGTAKDRVALLGSMSHGAGAHGRHRLGGGAAPVGAGGAGRARDPGAPARAQPARAGPAHAVRGLRPAPARLAAAFPGPPQRAARRAGAGTCPGTGCAARRRECECCSNCRPGPTRPRSCGPPRAAASSCATCTRCSSRPGRGTRGCWSATATSRTRAIDAAVAALAEIIRDAGPSDESGAPSASYEYDRTEDSHPGRAGRRAALRRPEQRRQHPAGPADHRVADGRRRIRHPGRAFHRPHGRDLRPARRRAQPAHRRRPADHARRARRRPAPADLARWTPGRWTSSPAAAARSTRWPWWPSTRSRSGRWWRTSRPPPRSCRTASRCWPPARTSARRTSAAASARRWRSSSRWSATRARSRPATPTGPLRIPATFGLPAEDDGSRNDPLLGQNIVTCNPYRHDFDALRAASTRVVIGVGAESGQMIAGRAAVAVAERLGTPARHLPRRPRRVPRRRIRPHGRAGRLRRHPAQGPRQLTAG